MSDIAGAVALVTGGSRGIGAAIVQELLDRGASKVYATARTIESVTNTDPASIARAAQAAGDVTVLINNAGLSKGGSFLAGDIDAMHLDMEANYFGPIRMARAFVPIIEGNVGGQILTVASALSWFTVGARGRADAPGPGQPAPGPRIALSRAGRRYRLNPPGLARKSSEAWR